MFTIVFNKKADKQLWKFSYKERSRILSAIESLREDPFSGKKLNDDLRGYYAIRVWPYRIVYTIQKQIVTITVVAIGHRKDVYRKL